MKTLSAALDAHMALELTTLATCWKVTRADGTVLGFTSHVEDLVIGGVTYQAAAGYTPTAIEGSADLSVDNLEVAGLLESPAITEGDLMAGVWDHAEIEIFEVNYADLTMGVNPLRAGRIGQVKVMRASFVAELNGRTQNLQQNILEATSAQCRATLGDVRCKVDLTDYTTTDAVTAVTSNRQFTSGVHNNTVRLTPSTTGNPPDGYFDRGLLTWLTGDNAGRAMEVKTYTVGSPAAGMIVLQLPMPDDIQVGDTFEIVAGCQKRVIEDCKTRFGNVVNFRGEPYKPAPNQLLRGPTRG